MGKIIDIFKGIKNKIMEDNLRKVILMCQKIAFDHHGGSILTFKPIEEDVYLYDELVKRGIMSVDPMEKDRYVFTQDLKEMYSDVPVREIIAPEVKEEPTGIEPKESEPTGIEPKEPEPTDEKSDEKK